MPPKANNKLIKAPPEFEVQMKPVRRSSIIGRGILAKITPILSPKFVCVALLLISKNVTL